MQKDLGEIEELAEKVAIGDRRSLARSITLIESDRADHQESARNLLRSLMPKTGKSLRIGISGAPGVGKSTFIETFGTYLVNKEYSLAVLAVDPSSRRSGGSILGDKTRMEHLAIHPRAFIRPSPAKQTLGGVGRHTREALLLCEAAGFDVVVVETVGVGQSEGTAASMVDMFFLIIAPGGGDELQGIKRGIVELADLVIVNKADGEFRDAAARVAREYQSALGLLGQRDSSWVPEIVTCSALKSIGIDKVWNSVLRYKRQLLKNDGFSLRRESQAKAWLWDEITEGLLNAVAQDSVVSELVTEFETKIKSKIESPATAAEHILSRFLDKRS